MCECRQFVEALFVRTLTEVIDEHRTDAVVTLGNVDRQRPHLGNLGAERGQFGTADDFAAAHYDGEPVRVHRNFVERARKQPALFEICRDESVQSRRILVIGPLDGQRRALSIPAHGHQAAPNVPSAASRRLIASFASASVMFSGGNKRTTVSAVRLTMTPFAIPAGTMGPASRFRSRPQISPTPRISPINSGYFFSSALSRCSNTLLTRFTLLMTPPSTSSVRNVSAARQARRFPPYVVP